MKTTASPPTLAIDGGPKACATPIPPRRLFGEDEKQAVVALFDECIDRGEAFGYQGERENQFCRAFAEQLGGGFADGVNSGTNALYVALRSLELDPWCEVIVPPVTDPGGVMPVALANCVPVIADAAPSSYNTSVDQIRAAITPATRAIVVAHIAGIPVDMPPIIELARQHQLQVVEDCAQSPGAICRDRPVGTWGDVASFSTMFGKHMATGGQGGVVFTRDESRYQRIRRFADRGKPFGLIGETQNVVASLNCNMDEMHAAVGLVQLGKLPDIVRRRRELALHLQKECQEQLQSVRCIGDPPHGRSSFWFVFLRLDLTQLRVDKKRFVEALIAEGVPASVAYWHCAATAPWFQQHRVFGNSALPWSAAQYAGPRQPQYPMTNLRDTEARHFHISLHESMTQKNMDEFVKAMKKVETAFR